MNVIVSPTSCFNVAQNLQISTERLNGRAQSRNMAGTPTRRTSQTRVSAEVI
jgi:hypothetical protein